MKATIIILALFVMCAMAKLPKFNVDPREITVSGISSGGFMAVQLHVAFSSTFKGVGVVAGGPYYCARGQITTAMTTCMALPAGTGVSTLIADTKQFHSQGKIDDPSNIGSHKVWMFSGTADTVVNKAVVKDLATYYQAFVNDESQIVTEFSIHAEHCQPTLNFGSACTSLGSPFINKCDYDAAGQILQHLTNGGTLNSSTTANSSALITFAQSDYHSSPTGIGMSENGCLCVPAGCYKGQTCSLHVALHGCQQNYETIGQDYVQHAGYNEWAESNNIIVLYPQAYKKGLMNPNGCWDWWGVTNSDYAFQNGVQMSAIFNMVKDLAGL